MSTIGTLICGSSSRGSETRAIMPATSAASSRSGVSGELMNVRVSAPGDAELHGVTTSSPSLRPARISTDCVVAGAELDDDLGAVLEPCVVDPGPAVDVGRAE